jgi:hypothetical protein
MLYGNIAVFDQTPLFNIAVFNTLDFKAFDFKNLDAGCARPPTRAPDRPSSTR